jgi:hypothetical protein
MITINIDKAKGIAHDMRRATRSSEFAPFDIKANIPSEAVAAEAARKTIRQKYAAIQIEIDNSQSVDDLKLIVSGLQKS